MSVFRTVDSPHMLFTASLSISGVLVSVWVLAVAVVVVSGVVAAGNVAVVNSDVVVPGGVQNARRGAVERVGASRGVWEVV
jgi:hypothetical protein